jgi:uncharacterized secreted protein with C-terminal beta-propeller domain
MLFSLLFVDTKLLGHVKIVDTKLGKQVNLWTQNGNVDTLWTQNLTGNFVDTKMVDGEKLWTQNENVDTKIVRNGLILAQKRLYFLYPEIILF